MEIHRFLLDLLGFSTEVIEFSIFRRASPGQEGAFRLRETGRERRNSNRYVSVSGTNSIVVSREFKDPKQTLGLVLRTETPFQGRKGQCKGQRLPGERRVILTFEVDGDLLGCRDGDVVVRGLAGEEGAEVTPCDLGDGEGVLDRGGVGRLVG